MFLILETEFNSVSNFFLILETELNSVSKKKKKKKRN